MITHHQLHTAQKQNWCWMISGYLLAICLIFALHWKKTKHNKFKSKLGATQAAPNHPQLQWVLGCHTLSLSLSSRCYCSLDDKAHVLPYSTSWWGVGGLFVWLPLSKTHAPIWRTHVLTKEKREQRRRRRGHRWPLFSWWWRWKDETRWPSVVRVCNL